MALAVALVGSTASGKSSIAIDLARRRPDLEIVSVDSMAVYRSMDIGTAKPSISLRQEIPHHMIDVLDPSEDCTVSLFQKLALRSLAEIHERGKLPLLVGGSGLYHRAVIDQLNIPAEYPEIRRRLEDEAQTQGGRDALYERLRDVDPIAAARLESSNQRRLVRALEVFEGSGQPFSSFGPGLNDYAASSIIQIGVLQELDHSDLLVNERVDLWMRSGFLEEVQALHHHPLGLSRTARQAIGYRELFDWLESSSPDEAGLALAIDGTKRRTRSLVRRQRSWFRRDPRVRWLSDTESIIQALSEALDHVAALRK